MHSFLLILNTSQDKKKKYIFFCLLIIDYSCRSDVSSQYWICTLVNVTDVWRVSSFYSIYSLLCQPLPFSSSSTLLPGHVIRLCAFSLCFDPVSSPPAGSLPYEYKVVIAGNHELTFDKDFMADLIKQDYYRFPSVSKLQPEDFDNVQSLLTNCIYLQDSEVTIKGFRIYGSPW